MFCFKLGSVLVLITLVHLSCTKEESSLLPDANHTEPRPNRQVTTPKRMEWINSVLGRYLWDFSLITSPNLACSRESELFKINLENFTLWAVQMYDSWSYVPSGSLYGDVHNVGNLDQCVAVRENPHNVIGRYCKVLLNYSPAQPDLKAIYQRTVPNFKYYQYDPAGSVYDKIKETQDKVVLPRNEIYLAFCIPSACSPEDLESEMNAKLTQPLRLEGYDVSFSVNPRSCYSSQDEKLPSTSFYLYLAFAFLLISLIVLGSLQDILTDEAPPKTSALELLNYFSIFSNSRRLVNPGRDYFDVVAVLKILFSFVLIFGHRMFGNEGYPVSNRQEIEERVVNMIETVWLNGAIIVNTFVVLSGFITFNKILQDIKVGKKIKLIEGIVRRWFRFTPLFAFFMVSYALLYPSFKNRLTDIEEVFMDACHSSWWTHVLYIHNYVQTNQQCLLTGWYLAMEMHLFTLCTIIGIIMQKSRRLGVFALGLSFAISIPIPGILTYYYQYEGVPKLYVRGIQPTTQSLEIHRLYFSSHTRAVSYLTGAVAAWFFNEMKWKQTKISKFYQMLIPSFSALCLMAIVVAPHQLHNPNYPYSPWNHALYASTDRLIWSTFISVLVVSHALYGYGPFDPIIKRGLYGALNKLSFCAMMIHPLVQFYSFSTTRYPSTLTHFNTHLLAVGDIASTYVLSLIVHLFFEAPTTRLCSRFLDKVVFWSKPKLADRKKD